MFKVIVRLGDFIDYMYILKDISSLLSFFFIRLIFFWSVLDFVGFIFLLSLFLVKVSLVLVVFLFLCCCLVKIICVYLG